MNPVITPVIAHVGYVTDEQPSPNPIGFLLDVLADPVNLLWLAGGAIVLLAAVAAWAAFRPMEPARRRFVEHAATYRAYVPWMLRLSVGLVLIGAGLSRVLFAPDVQLEGWPYAALTAIGFLLLLGFAVRAAALAGLALYLAGLVIEPRLFQIFDVAGGLAAAALVGPGEPSLDSLLRHAFPGAWGGRLATLAPSSRRYDDLLPLLVRLGLGGAFIASGIADKLLIYVQALAAVDQYNLTAVVPVDAGLWVVGAALIETALGVAIVLGLLTRFAAMVGFAVLTLTLFALPDDPVVAHIGLFGLSSILVVLGAGRLSVDHALGQVLGRIDARQAS